MKLTLVCTECDERFTLYKVQSWDGLECPSCGFTGNVIGRIIDGEKQYFEDETVTEEIPVVE